MAELVAKMKEQHNDRFAYDKLGAHNKIIKKDLLGELDNEIVECYPVIKLLNQLLATYADVEQVEILANHIEGESTMPLPKPTPSKQEEGKRYDPRR